MERIVYRKTLDVHKNGIQFTLQGFETADNMARKIEISLMASGDTIDIPLEQITAMMYVTTPSATEPSINACTIKGNTIIYDVLPIVEEGITEMQLKLIETRPNGAKGVLPSPRFAVEVAKSNADDEGAAQSPTFTALEDAIARANGVYDSRLIGIELDEDCTFRAKYADGTIYESDVLKELFLKGDVLLSQSYAKGGTGIRAGEDTDNSMYYSNVSKSASAEADRISGEATELLEEVRKHGVYTSFSIDFDTGEVIYKSPSYTFSIDKESGELKAEGRIYDSFPIESVEFPGHYYRIVDDEEEWINPPYTTEYADSYYLLPYCFRTQMRHKGKPVYVARVNSIIHADADDILGFPWKIDIIKNSIFIYGSRTIDEYGEYGEWSREYIKELPSEVSMTVSDNSYANPGEYVYFITMRNTNDYLFPQLIYSAEIYFIKE